MILRIIISSALLVAVSCQDCGGTWKRYQNTCYLVRTRVNVWGEARKDCQTYSGDLALVKDQATNQYLYDLLADTKFRYWLGGHDRSNEGQFEWIDGDAFNTGFTNWAPGQPDDFSQLGEDCVEINTEDGTWNDNNCVVPRYYICARDINTPIKCDEEDGWREFNNKCYLWVPDRRKWKDAEAYCTLLDGHLPAVESQAEQDFLTSTQMAIDLEYWLGLSDMYGNQAGDHSWTDPNTQYGDGYYSNWDVDEPRNIFYNLGGDCAAIDDPETGIWKIDRCDQTKRHFCERQAGTCATGWKQFNGQCYQVNANNPMTWTDSKHYCEAQGGYLMTIMGDAENQFVAVQLPELRGAGNTQIYIGISDTQIDGNFQWVHGASVGYTNWNDHQPVDTNGQYDCGVIYTGDLSARWDTANCFNPTGFICKIQVGRPVTDIPPDGNVGSCDNGWSLFGDSCYNFVVDDRQSWGNADLACQGMGARIVSIHTGDEQSFISTRSDAIRDRMWLGLHDTGGEGNFIWADDSPVDFTNWAPGEPNNAGGEDCVHTTDSLHNYGMWNDNGCDEDYYYICKKDKYPGGSPPTEPPPPTPIYNDKCGQDWEYDGASSVYDGRCYKFAFSDYKRWNDAVYQCRTEGGDLVSISGNDEQSFINGRMQATFEGALWIGASDLSAEGGWEWSDGAPMRYINWNAGEPNNVGDEGEHCVEAYTSNGYWNDNWCERQIGYICKASAILHHYFVPHRLRRFDGNTYYKLTVTDMWPKECAEICMLEQSFQCRSFDYDRTLRTCMLSDVSSDTVGLIPAMDGYPYDHFEMDLSAPPLNPVTTVAPSYGCPSGWKAWGSNCYYVNLGTANYADSRQLCTMQSADLTSIRDLNENNFIVGFVHESAPQVSRAWIGLNDLTTERTYEWTDNTMVTYTNWAYYEPNNAGQEDCVEMYQNNGRWNDLPCTGYDYNSICKRKRYSGGQPPSEPGCESGWKAYMSSCYYFSRDDTSRKTWSDAKADCTSMGAHLVVINDMYESAFLSGQQGLETTGPRYWIGLSDIETPGFYKWVDGAPVLYTNWGVGQPDDSKGKCVGSTSAVLNAGYWYDLNCEEIYPYTCERLRDGYTTVSPNPPSKTNPSNIGCAAGWIGYGSQCFRVYEEDRDNNRRTWESARSFCMDAGGDLASFHSPEEETYIRDSYEAQDPDNDYGYWVGLNDRTTEGFYEWSDGTPVEYTNWGPGEPNDHGGIEECVELFLNPGRGWNDLDCGGPRHWICRIPKGTPPATVSPPPSETKCPLDDDWSYRHPYCYFASEAVGGMRRTWGQADQWCKDNGGFLVSIHDMDEHKFVNDLTTRLVSSYWIGLREYSVEGEYSWSDGSPLDFTNWNPGEPNDAHGEEQCAELEMFDEGRWNDNACGIDNAFICKRPFDNTDPITNAPTVPPEGGCPNGWYKLLNKCYQLVGYMDNDRKNWFDARDDCQAYANGNLATLHNKQQQAAVTTLMRGAGTYDVWIGLSDLGSAGKFHWTDGSDLDYTNWGIGQPDGSVLFPGEGQVDCVEMMADEDHPGKWNDVECTDTRNAYLCQIPLDADLPDNPPQVGECTMAEGEYLSYFNQCFRLVTNEMSYSDARAFCEEDSTTLATIKDGYEEAFIETLIYTNALKYVWIGLTDKDNTGIYQWLDGWPVLYTNWGRNEPSMREGEGCVRMSDNPDWQDTDCTNSHPFVCKISFDTIPKTPAPPKGYCLDGWTPYDTDCYLFDVNQKRLGWPDAVFDCAKYSGGKLVSIHNKAQNKFIQENAATAWGVGSIWIGLTRDSDGGWIWDDRSAVDYVNWADGEPNGFENGENCAELYDDQYGKWNDEDCFNNAGYVCVMKQYPYPPDASRSPQTQTGLSAGGIVGIVFGILIIGVLVVMIGWFIMNRSPGPKFNSDDAMAATAGTTGFENTLYATSGDKDPIVSDA